MATQAYARTPYSPTRFPAGVTNSNVGDVTQNLGEPDRTKFFTDFEDFATYTAALWTITGAPTVVGVPGFGGLVNISVGDDPATFRRASAAFEATPGKQIFFKIRLTAGAVSNTVFWAGLFNAGATPANATDGIYFSKPDAVNTLDVSVRQNATTGANNVTGVGLIDDTTTLGFWYDGKQTVRFYQDDNLIATVAATPNFLPDVALQLAFGVSDGASGSNEELNVDYIYASQER